MRSTTPGSKLIWMVLQRACGDRDALSGVALARADIANFLTVSAERWGGDARRRYAALLAAAFRLAASMPHRKLTRDRGNLLRGLCSLHLRHVNTEDLGSSVKSPVHVIYFRILDSELIEIVRVLHERMEPNRHVGRGYT